MSRAVIIDQTTTVATCLTTDRQTSKPIIIISQIIIIKGEMECKNCDKYPQKAQLRMPGTRSVCAV